MLPAYVAWRAGMTNRVIVLARHRLAKSISWNRFPGSLNVYKFWLSMLQRSNQNTPTRRKRTEKDSVSDTVLKIFNFAWDKIMRTVVDTVWRILL